MRAQYRSASVGEILQAQGQLPNNMDENSETLRILTLDSAFLDDPLLSAGAGADAVTLLCANVAGSEVGEAVILDGVFLIVQQCDVPLCPLKRQKVDLAAILNTPSRQDCSPRSER